MDRGATGVTSREALQQTTPHCAKKSAQRGPAGEWLRRRTFCEANAQCVLSDRTERMSHDKRGTEQSFRMCNTGGCGASALALPPLLDSWFCRLGPVFQVVERNGAESERVGTVACAHCSSRAAASLAEWSATKSKPPDEGAVGTCVPCQYGRSLRAGDRRREVRRVVRRESATVRPMVSR